MSEIKRGYAVLLQGGDGEISEALAGGILQGRGLTAGRLEAGGVLSDEAIRAVEAEMDRQAIAGELFDERAVAHRMRVAMHPEPVDYDALIADARGKYRRAAVPRWLRVVMEKLLVGYALLALYVVALYRAQDRVLGER